MVTSLYSGEGKVINSHDLDGLNKADAIDKIIKIFEKLNKGKNQ